jgi:IclR family acetate operon transcriptional repressor
MGVKSDRDGGSGPLAEHKATAPAVERAIAILRHLQAHVDPRARTVTRIAEALGIHKSSCSNLLWTLEAAGFADYAPDSRAFQLGAELISLGASAAKDRDFVRAAAGPMEALVASAGMTCVAFEQLASDEFVIVSKVESAREIKVTIDVGQHFHPATPALARLVAAFSAPERAGRYIDHWQGRVFTPHTRRDRVDVARQVAVAREQGYAVSVGEYYAGNTAIAAPVFSSRDATFRGLCLVTFREEVDEADLPRIGRVLRRAADEISASLGGAPPDRAGLQAREAGE